MSSPLHYLRPSLIAVAVSLTPLTQAAEMPTPEQMWKMIQQQQQQIQALQQALKKTDAKADTATEVAENTADAVEAVQEDTAATNQWFANTQVGGYGELHYNNFDTVDGGDFKEADLHRFVLFFNHQFSDQLRFFSELEVEHAIAGDGQNGEVEVEQAFIEYDFNDYLTARGGLFLLPVGILNETHEPPTFYGVERNPVENIIIPATWWEGGAGLSGHFANGLSWDAALTTGLAIPTSGSNAGRIRSGRQKVSEALANDGAFTTRLKYTGIPGLELSGSLQYQQDADQGGEDFADSAWLYSAHGIYQRGAFGLRALWARWDFDGDGIRALGGDQQDGWYLEPSFKLRNDLGLYARYSDVDGIRTQDQFSQAEAGLNFWPHEDVVIKLDYRSRDYDHENQVKGGAIDHGFDIGIGYQF